MAISFAGLTNFSVKSTSSLSSVVASLTEPVSAREPDAESNASKLLKMAGLTGSFMGDIVSLMVSRFASKILFSSAFCLVRCGDCSLNFKSASVAFATAALALLLLLAYFCKISFFSCRNSISILCSSSLISSFES